jgi:putative transposase
MNILALLQCIQPELSTTNLRRMSRITQAMLSMTGRVTMLGISRWAGKGGSYRTVQRFFNAAIPWQQVFGKFFEQHLHQEGLEYILVGDESVATKSGKETHGLDHFFSGLLNRVVKGIAIFSLSLVCVEERQAYPVQVKQIVRTETEKAEAKARKKNKPTAKGSAKLKKKPGRPKGSKNRDKTQVELTPELLRIQNMVKNQLQILKKLLTIRYLALDGHFGNNNALQMVLQCGLHLVSKLRHDAALYFIYEGKQNRTGPRRKYGQKVDYRHLPEKYLVETSIEDGIKTCVYQARMLHRSFAQALNIVIITKTNLKTGAVANVNLFSSELALSYQKIIDFYSLRFQIEFNFRDAKQHWGLEDFMNVKELPLTNAINLSLFMVNLSQALLRDFRECNPECGVLDLKAYFRAAKYFEETIKLLPQKPDCVKR